MAGIKLFELPSIMEAVGTQQKNTAARQEFEMESTVRRQTLTQDALLRTKTIADQASQMEAKTIKEQQAVLSGVQDQLIKATEAMRLSDSDNPMDRLSLYLMQQADPAGYTREGNLARLQYLQGASQALGTVNAVNQAGFTNAMSTIERELAISLQSDADHLEILKLTEAQGAQSIQSLQEAQAATLGYLQNQNAMQDAAMANFDIGQINSLEQQALNSPDGRVNAGGVDLSLAALQARKGQLIDREYNLQVRQNSLVDEVLKNMTMDQVVQAKTQAGNNKGVFEQTGITLSLARLNDRENQILAGDTSAASNSRSLMAMAQERVINTFNKTELNRILANGGIDQGGISYDLDMLKARRDSLVAEEQNQTMQTFQMEMMGDPAAVPLQHKNYLESLKAPPGSVMEAEIERSKRIVNTAAGLIQNAGGDQQMIINASSALTANRESMEQVISNEAKRLSNGDREKEQAYSYTLRGQQIPQAVVLEALTTRMAKGQPVGDWLEPRIAGKFTVAYQNELAGIKNDMVLGGTADLDIATQRSMAAERAMNLVQAEVTAGMTDQVMLAQLNDPENPLRRVFGENRQAVLELLFRADQEGAQAYQAAAGLSAQDMALRLTGQVADPNLVSAQNAQLLIALDKVQPGLSKAYTDWWGSGKRKTIIDAFAAGMTQEAAGDFAKSAQYALVLPTLNDTMSGYAQSLLNAEQNLMSEQLRKEHSDYVNFGNDPASMQVFALEMAGNLTTAEKQNAMQTVIMPLITQATAQNMSQQETNTYVETMLRTTRFESPEQRSLVKKIMESREAALGTMDKFAQSQTLWAKTPLFGGGIAGIIAQMNGGIPGIAQLFQGGNDAATRQANAFEWWTAIKGK